LIKNIHPSLDPLTKKTFTVTTQKTNRMTDCTHLQQPWRKTLLQNACMHDRPSVNHWWRQSASQKCQLSILETGSV